MKARVRPIKDKHTPGTYRWNGLIIKRQDNGLWGVWFNYRDKHSDDHRTLKDCMEAIDLHWKRKSRTHLQLVRGEQ